MASARAVTSVTSSSNSVSSTASALSAASAILRSSSFSSTVVKRTALASVWRWMKVSAALPVISLSAWVGVTSI